MVKVVNSFKGKTTEELQKLPNDELFALLNARQRRSLKRGLSDNKKKLIAEIKEAKDINAIALLDNGRALNISQLTSLIKSSSFVIANDTGPAHIAAHTGTRGLTLFGKHTTAYKVSIKREYFQVIEVDDLNNLSAEKVFERLINLL